MAILEISANEHTEEVIQYILDGLSDNEVDALQIDRQVQKPDGLASEPVTTAVLITLGTVAASAVLRLLERWLENQRQLEQLRLVADGFTQSDEAGKQLAALAAKNSTVAASYGIAMESWRKTSK